MNKEVVTVHMVFKGDVQGVGFRATALKTAKGIGLKGTVANLSDGTVELCLQGRLQEIELFIEMIKLSFGNHIQEIIRNDENEPKELFDCFKIIH